MSIRIGPYVEGEIPEPLEYQFLDASGAALNLAGYTAAFRLKVGVAPTLVLPAAVSTPAEGRVEHVWQAGELATSRSVRCQFWVTNGTNSYASKLLMASVEAAT